MIKVDKLVYAYPHAGKDVLKNISFRVNKGEIFGFLGPSGAGKSTAQKVLNGILKNYIGSVVVDGRELSKIEPSFYENIGVAFEFPNLYLKLSALENLKMYAITLKYDLLQIRKDPMLMLSIFVPFMLWAMMQFGFPIAQNLLNHQAGIDINPFYQQAGMFLLIIIPMMFGMVYGFMLLDERDGGIITAISVTPLGRSGYLRMRMGLPMLLSFIASLMFCFLLDIGIRMNIFQLFILLLILTLYAPIILLFFGAFADNKVEGMAISKGYGILMSAVLIDFIVPSPWNWLGAFSPLFWFERAFMANSNALFVMYLTLSALLHVALMAWLYRRFSRKID